jgi:hypothetical protein
MLPVSNKTIFFIRCKLSYVDTGISLVKHKRKAAQPSQYATKPMQFSSNSRNKVERNMKLNNQIKMAMGFLVMTFPYAAISQTNNLPAILSDPAVTAANPIPDYSYAGYGFGTAQIPQAAGTIIDVTNHGVVSNDGIDDTKAVMRALAAAASIDGQVTLRFPAGRVQITEVLRLDRSNIVLDGAGSGEAGTELYFPRPLKVADRSNLQNELRDYLVREDKFQRDVDQNLDTLFSEYSWSGGFIFTGPKNTRPVSYDGTKDVRDPVLSNAIAGRQFAKALTVANPGALRVGQVIQVQWFSIDGPNSAILKSLYGNTDLPIGSHHWTFPNRPVVGQSTRIIAIDGNEIIIGDPLLHDVSSTQPAVIANWEHLTNVGIQNMRLAFPPSPFFGHHVEQGYNGIYMTGVFDGWISNLVVHNSDSAILTDNAANLTIKNITTTGEHTAHYSVHVGAVHNVLVRDLVVANPVVHPVSINTRASRSVYQNAIVLRDAIIDQHSGSNHQNLFDNLTMYVTPKREAGKYTYRLWVGGGAGYWKPGHGLMNTSWNVKLITSGVPVDETIAITSGLEGPGGRVVGLHSDRPITLDYRPNPYSELTGTAINAVPSLYDYQLAKRTALVPAVLPLAKARRRR